MASNPKSPFEIPAYLQAVEREGFLRSAAFIPGLTENVGSFEAAPLALRHYEILRMSKNALLRYEIPSKVELSVFLWVVNPGFCYQKKPRERFLKTCRVFSDSQVRAETADAAMQYMAEAMSDRPPIPKIEGYTTEYYCGAAAVCERFAREYGWTIEQTMNVSFKCLFQLMKVRQEIHNLGLPPAQRVPMCNPSDRILFEFTAGLNRN